MILFCANDDFIQSVTTQVKHQNGQLQQQPKKTCHVQGRSMGCSQCVRMLIQLSEKSAQSMKEIQYHLKLAAQSLEIRVVQ